MAYDASYISTDLDDIFVDTVGLIGATLNEHMNLIVLLVIISLVIGLVAGIFSGLFGKLIGKMRGMAH